MRPRQAAAEINVKRMRSRRTGLSCHFKLASICFASCASDESGASLDCQLDGGGFATRPLWLRKGAGPLLRQPYRPNLFEDFEDQDIGFRWQDYADEEAAA